MPLSNASYSGPEIYIPKDVVIPVSSGHLLTRIGQPDLGTVKPVRTEGVFGILPKTKGGSVGLLNILAVFGRLPVFSVFYT
jgi:hypothetical protein